MENDREKEKEKMGSAIVTLKKGEGRTVKSGGMWIYDNEIASIVGSFEDGDIVIVHDFDGYPLGKGFINRHSKIRIRLMTRDCSQEVNLDFLRMRGNTASALWILQAAVLYLVRPIFCRD